MSRSEVTMREVLLADMYQEQIDRLTAELIQAREYIRQLEMGHGNKEEG